MNKNEMNKEHMNTSIALDLKNITKTFQQGGETLSVLKGINLSIRAGESIALVGSSGSGKSTLLQIAGLLDRPTSGDVILSGNVITGLKEKKQAVMRRDHIGFVYQFHHLLPEFTALENVMMPLIIQGIKREKAEAKAQGLLTKMNLGHRLEHRPSRLSGGEQQRVAILRALVTNPRVLLADEPTGNLDVDTSAHVFSELMSLIKEHQMGALIATHDPALAKKMDRIVYLDHGILRE